MSEVDLRFLGVGPQRTASSWLDQTLRAHPDVALPTNVKETMFFDERFHKGMKWYAWHFRQVGPHQKAGEIAPTYFDHMPALKRVAERYPHLRILINVRNPVERAYSLFRHHAAKGRVPPDFHRAVKVMPRILGSGHYGRFAPAWEAAFGVERVWYVVQEDIAVDPQEVMQQVYCYLGLSNTVLPEVAHVRYGGHRGFGAPRSPSLARLTSATATFLRSHRLHRIAEWGKRAGFKMIYCGREIAGMTREHYKELVQFYEDDIRWLEKRCGRSFTGWRKPGEDRCENADRRKAG